MQRCFLVLTCVQVPAESKICQRQWHSITAIPANDLRTSVFVVVIGGVTERDVRSDPTKWTKADANYVLEFSKQFCNNTLLH